METRDRNRARIATGFRATLQSLGWIGMEAGIDDLERTGFVKKLYAD